MTGLYIHVPFCVSKCPYCDFYSLTNTSDTDKDAYVDAVIRSMAPFADVAVDTVYFGGGTPSLLGGQRIAHLLDAVHAHFQVAADSEITLEANPGDRLYDTAAAFVSKGGNRVSLGMQSINDRALQVLGRRHTVSQTEHAIRELTRAGIRNVSLDLMLATPGQTAHDVREAIRHADAWGASHVSAYLLKVEPGTPYAKHPPHLPNEDETVALYHTAAETLEQHGFWQYEISNFAKSGKQSRHNLKYWNLDPYIGLGPSAHSFWQGQRWYYPRSLKAFIDGTVPLPEEEAVILPNSPAEYAMLRLRLTEGLTEQAFYARYGSSVPEQWRRRAASLPSSLITADEHGIRLTREGFLVSDALLSRLLLE